MPTLCELCCANSLRTLCELCESSVRSAWQDLKIRYNRQMIQFYNRSGDYFPICKCYRAIFNTKKARMSGC